MSDAETGELLIGASVRVQGTNNGAITDYNGDFSITLSDPNATLQVSYTGYADQIIPVAGQTKLTIAMVTNAAIEEIVVVGYGTQKKKRPHRIRRHGEIEGPRTYPDFLGRPGAAGQNRRRVRHSGQRRARLGRHHPHPRDRHAERR